MEGDEKKNKSRDASWRGHQDYLIRTIHPIRSINRGSRGMGTKMSKIKLKKLLIKRRYKLGLSCFKIMVNLNLKSVFVLLV